MVEFKYLLNGQMIIDTKTNIVYMVSMVDSNGKTARLEYVDKEKFESNNIVFVKHKLINSRFFSINNSLEFIDRKDVVLMFDQCYNTILKYVGKQFKFYDCNIVIDSNDVEYLYTLDIKDSNDNIIRVEYKAKQINIAPIYIDNKNAITNDHNIDQQLLDYSTHDNLLDKIYDILK